MKEQVSIKTEVAVMSDGRRCEAWDCRWHGGETGKTDCCHLFRDDNGAPSCLVVRHGNDCPERDPRCVSASKAKDKPMGITGGLALAGVLTVVFIVLKLAGVIGWSWDWVVSPAWIAFGAMWTVVALGFSDGALRALLRVFRKKAGLTSRE